MVFVRSKYFAKKLQNMMRMAIIWRKQAQWILEKQLLTVSEQVYKYKGNFDLKRHNLKQMMNVPRQ